MTEQRCITDELREFAPHLDLGKVALAGWKEGLLAIADRIDKRHEDAMFDARTEVNGESYDAGFDAGFASADDWLAQHEDAMAEHGWVKLPVDADGEAWHIGDRTESGQTIEAMGLNKHGWHFVGTVNEIDPAIHRHYHAPTVEDVLRDMHAKLDEVTALYVGEAIDSDERDSDEARIFAEYAAKLQLKEDA